MTLGVSEMSFYRHMKFTAFLFAILALAPFSAFGQVVVELSADRTEAFITDEIILRFTILSEGDISDPQLKNAVSNFEVISARQAREEISVNGKAFQKALYVYRLRPRRPGDFSIGPASCTVDGKRYETTSVSVLVRAEAPPAPTAARGSVFADARLLASKGYPGQEMIFRLSIYHEPPLSDKIGVSLPDVENLAFSQVGESTDREVVISGRPYGVTEASWAITASKPGVYRIPPVDLKVTVTGQMAMDDGPLGMGMPSDAFPGFMLRQTRVVDVSTQPLTLVVKAFPEKGRPADFGGLVGRFKVEASLAPSSVKTGEAATLTVTLKGRGNVALLPDLSLKDVEGLKIYADRPVFSKTQISEGTRGEKVLKWALIPQARGEYSIPAFSLSFFNPETGAYETARTPVLTLSVPKGERQTAAAAFEGPGRAKPDQEEDPLVRDIQTIHENAGAVLSPDGGMTLPLALSLFFLPLLPLAVSVFARSVSARNRGQARNNFAKKALPVFLGALKKIPPDDAEALFKALSTYLTVRLSGLGGSITPTEARDMLVNAKVGREDADRLAGVFASLEAAVFSRTPTAFTEEDRKRLGTMVKTVDKAIRKQ
ncbi:MAG: protein BatD [Deltaproteobacteria bacterium]|nr:protein BatD [Deltaproteobacteria bacterium]